MALGIITILMPMTWPDRPDSLTCRRPPPSGEGTRLRLRLIREPLFTEQKQADYQGLALTRATIRIAEDGTEPECRPRNQVGCAQIGGTFGGTERRHGASGRQFVFKFGADGRIRTGDPLFTKQLLYQLSYVGLAPII